MDNVGVGKCGHSLSFLCDTLDHYVWWLVPSFLSTFGRIAPPIVSPETGGARHRDGKFRASPLRLGHIALQLLCAPDNASHFYWRQDGDDSGHSVFPGFLLRLSNRHKHLRKANTAKRMNSEVTNVRTQPHAAAP
jgi:hypothetical protein